MDSDDGSRIALAFGEIFRDVRVNHWGLTQSQYAAILGFPSRFTIARIERGEQFSTTVLNAVAKNLNVQPDSILLKTQRLIEKHTGRSWQQEFSQLKIPKGSRLNKKPSRHRNNVELSRSLGAKYPWILEYWDFDANGDLDPFTISKSYKGYINWRCKKGSDHRFRSTAKQFIALKSPIKCIFCRGLRASITNSLASLYPEHAVDFDEIKNGRTASEVVAKPATSTLYFWKCAFCKSCRMSIRERIAGVPCPCRTPKP